jgi:hypothetical protein
MPDLSFDTSILSNTADLAPVSLDLPGLVPGATGRILRRATDDLLRSVIVDVPAGWDSGALVGQSGQQGYVLSGTLSDGDAVLSAGTFFFHPAGHPFAWRCAEPVQLILILNGPQVYQQAGGAAPRADAIVALQPRDVAITPSVIDGKASGVIRRVLWKDPETGADTRHLTIPKGVSGLGAEWHPCNEEIYCLTREEVVGDQNGFRPGHFLFNPAFAVHGGNRTENIAETTLLEWHDGLWEIHRYTD